MKTKYIIFDLDDTLAYEIDYLKSAYKEIAFYLEPNSVNDLYIEMIETYNSGLNVFDLLIIKYPSTSKDQLLEIYRNHYPSISLIDGALDIIQHIKALGFKLGLITDGRTITQRNKLKALGIEEKFDKIIISEEFGSTKPDPNNYKAFLEDEIEEYYYIADNPKKDFISPNQLGWTSICLLNNGWNIHPQNFDLSKSYLPQLKISNLNDLKEILKT